jgi:hypothetical protein
MSGFAGMLAASYKPPVIVEGGGGGGGGLSSGDFEPAALLKTLSGNWGGSNPTGTGDFTWEGWFYNTVRSDNQMIFETRDNSGGSGWAIRTLSNDGGTSYQFLYIYGGGTAEIGTVTNNAWHHLAVCRSSGTSKVYFNGSQIVSVSDSGNYTANNWRVGGYWGTYNNYLAAWNFAGYLDEFRYSNVARYSGSSITVPTAAFTSDADTLLLLHFDGTNGGTTFTDSSSYNRTVTEDGGGVTTTTAFYQF